MFGTKKIFAKIINGKLVIRVGGGYMGIDEFIKVYAEQELLKVQRYEELHNINPLEEDQYLELEAKDIQHVGKQNVVGVG